MMGPQSIGSTEDEYKCWKLLYSLRTIIKWGTEEFEGWVRKNMLAKGKTVPDFWSKRSSLPDRV